MQSNFNRAKWFWDPEMICQINLFQKYFNSLNAKVAII